MHAAQVAETIRFFEQLTPQSLSMLDCFYAPAARFKDPFNDVQGLGAIDGVYRHMFKSLAQPRFVITSSIVQDAQCFLAWDFNFRLHSRPDAGQTIRGGSHLVLDSDGRITVHRDYWDAAEELYEKLPLLGTLMRWLKRRVNASS